MTTAPISQVTGPLAVRRVDGPALPSRRPTMTLAQIRRARRRVTHIAAPARTFDVSTIELAVGGVALLVAGIASVGWMVVL